MIGILVLLGGTIVAYGFVRTLRRTDDEAYPATEELQAAEAESSDEFAIPCPNCGRLVAPGFRFCDGCGQPL